MKKILLLIVMCCSVFLFAQFITTKEILRINTYEKNIKDILFAKEVSNIQTSFLLKAENKSSKDFTKCKWITSMSKEELMYFADGLESLVPASSSENKLFRFVYKNDKIKIHIKESKCTSEHRMYYFQKSCNRKLSFVILPNQVSQIVSDLRKAIKEIHYVRK
tara:strand:- start:60 stop:548 length:489 start_codon:yes stop_codon:yes gene_type:complete